MTTTTTSSSTSATSAPAGAAGTGVLGQATTTTAGSGAPVPAAAAPVVTTGERADFQAALAKHRFFLRLTVRDLTDEQVGLSPTDSVLCLGGLIKHVASMERLWLEFALTGAEAFARGFGDYDDEFRMHEGETVAGVLENYERIARRTDEIVATLPDLDLSHPLPEAPWFEQGASWSVRRVLLHVIAETAQHAGHADIIRETLDGSRTMG
jgi:hypothetical protein